MFKGFINIMSDPRECFELSQSIPNTKIISLDEEDMYIELDPNNNPNVIKGTILLPPIEALWAESDGNLQAFNEAYYRSLSTKEVSMFINTLLGYIFNGGNIIIFSPEFDEGGLDTTIHIQFLLEYLEKGYGLHLGRNNDVFRYDILCIPMYLIGIYELGIIDEYTLLSLYPIDAEIPNDLSCVLILKLKIYGESLDEKLFELQNIKRLINKNNRIRNAIIQV